jgi:hypothetical protein
MAVVYRARDVRLDRWVALKVLAPEFARDDAFRQRFIRKPRAAAAVDHPNIIPIFDAGAAGGVLFIATTWCSTARSPSSTPIRPAEQLICYPRRVAGGWRGGGQASWQAWTDHQRDNRHQRADSERGGNAPVQARV